MGELATHFRSTSQNERKGSGNLDGTPEGVTTNARTRSRREATRKRNIPYIGPIEDEYCCEGTITIPVEQLDTYQQIPFGTPAWKQRYTSRMQIENLNNIVKNTGGLKDGWCRALGATANMGVLALIVANDLRQARRYLIRKLSTGNSEQSAPPNGAAPAAAPSTNGTSPRGPPQ